MVATTDPHKPVRIIGDYPAHSKLPEKTMVGEEDSETKPGARDQGQP